MKEIKIYTSNTCEYCKVVKNELEKNNIKFEEKIIDDWEEEWASVVKLTEMNMTPVINYKDSYFISGRDYGNPEQLVKILKVFKKSKFSESRQIDEKIKTLNYNMANAFNRMEEMLVQIDVQLNHMN
tara:strand:- start:195 stop:575 length:381 start_codon:yes stop_codon:yes gene_type:complete